jgi:hypothetical protein
VHGKHRIITTTMDCHQIETTQISEFVSYNKKKKSTYKERALSKETALALP